MAAPNPAIALKKMGMRAGLSAKCVIIFINDDEKEI